MRKKWTKFISISALILFLATFVGAQSFKPVFFKLQDIKDVSKTAATNGQVLTYVSATGLWTPSAATGGAPTDAHYFTDQAESGLSAEVVVSANGKSLVTAANYAAMRTLLDLEVGTDFNAYDADLTTWAGVTPSANGQSLVSGANYAAMRTLLDLEVGVDFNAYDADLTTYAGITPSANAQTLLGETFAQMLTSIAASPLAGSSSIVTTGTVTAGTWNALYKDTVTNSGNNATVDLTAAGTCYGQTYTNAGNDSDTHYDLPAAVVGMSMTFYVKDAYTITTDPNGTDRILVLTSANGDYMLSDAVIGTFIAFKCLAANTWNMVGMNGSWTEE